MIYSPIFIVGGWMTGVSLLADMFATSKRFDVYKGDCCFVSDYNGVLDTVYSDAKFDLYKFGLRACRHRLRKLSKLGRYSHVYLKPGLTKLLYQCYRSKPIKNQLNTFFCSSIKTNVFLNPIYPIYDLNQFPSIIKLCDFTPKFIFINRDPYDQIATILKANSGGNINNEYHMGRFRLHDKKDAIVKSVVEFRHGMEKLQSEYESLVNVVSFQEIILQSKKRHDFANTYNLKYENVTEITKKSLRNVGWGREYLSRNHPDILTRII
jgi:hypothetical protein